MRYKRKFYADTKNDNGRIRFRSMSESFKSPEKEQKDGLQISFSPVNVKSSPKTKSTKNLTGSSRKVKDTAADIHNLQQKWNKLNMDGSNIVSQIANIKLKSMFSGDNEEENNLIDAAIPPELEPLCENLSTITDKMAKIVEKFESFVRAFKGLQELAEFQSNTSSNDENDFLFQTWTIGQYEVTTKEICSMYQKELQLKHHIRENICHVKDRDTMMFYTASWLHQPYIEDTCTLMIESMLLETGHR